MILNLQPGNTLVACDTLAMEAAKAWFQLQCKDVYASLYLWHKTGAVAVASNQPDGFTLSSSKRLGPGASRQQIENELRSLIRKLPIL